MGHKIRILASTDAAVGSKSLLGDRATAIVTELDSDQLRAGLEALTAALALALQTQPNRSGEFALKQFEVGLELTVEGGVVLIGTLTTGATAAVKLIYERV